MICCASSYFNQSNDMVQYTLRHIDKLYVVCTVGNEPFKPNPILIGEH